MHAKPRFFMGLVLASVMVISTGVNAAQRVVSIGGTVTEIVYLLGAESQLVASDTSSIYPEAANQTPKVGYQRTLSAEGVLSVHPDTLLITPAAGPAKVLQQLKDTGINLITIEAPDTKQGILDKITQVASALHQEEKGKHLVQQIEHAFEALSTPKAWHEQHPPRLLFVLQMGGAPMVAGKNTAPDALFTLAGATNAVGTLDGYKALTPEAILLAQPDAIVVTQQGLSRTGKQAIWALPGMLATPAGKNQRMLSLDALLALGLGPRTPEAIQSLQQQLEEWAP
ncbi:heme/hemin ABC transporter substrate-binding protein [Marinomonas shanghaiensis]|uniref:heme/hemin ABC transporter substrate-binding protein n=1 Tax=Marinomonas shanghaiensis TaxID=2202418 RepID=UPI003A947FC0